MKNGYLEGFCLFKDAKTKKDLVSLPYYCFKGNYQDLVSELRNHLCLHRRLKTTFHVITQMKAGAPLKKTHSITLPS